MKILSKFLCLTLSVCLLFALTSCDNNTDPEEIIEVIYYDGLGYVLKKNNNYKLVDVKSDINDVRVPKTLPNGGIVNEIDLIESRLRCESFIVPDNVTVCLSDAWVKHLYIGERVDLDFIVNFDQNRTETIEISETNPKYYAKGNCIIEKETQKLVYGFRTSEIPEGVKIIGVSAFSDCIFEEIHIPDSVERIEHSAFAYCRALQQVYIGENVKTILDCAFYGTPTLVINCEADSKPSGWDSEWINKEKDSRPHKQGCKEVNWGVKRDAVE
ncbi:MAG: leucine-rich repeat domain-containing protein [Clostridia bacterium]|nr:leucine-rich repeat domain-containing protein [Clostridia bacterium]